MSSNLQMDGAKKVVLEDLSKEELIKKCKGLLGIAQKAKQAKDVLSEENNELKDKLKSQTTISSDTSNEIIESLTQQKLLHVTQIEELSTKFQKALAELNVTKETNEALDNKNVSLERQVGRLTEENEILIESLDTVEKKLEQLKVIELEQQSKLLELESHQNENLQCDFIHCMEEIKKLQTENEVLQEKNENLKINLSEKDTNIVIISEELSTSEKKYKQLLIDYEKLQKTCAEFQVDVGSLKEEVNSKNDEILKVKQNSELELESSVERLKDKLKLYHSKIVKLAHNLKALRENKDEILDMFKSYRNQVENWRHKLHTASIYLISYLNRIEEENLRLKEDNARFMEQLKTHKTDDEKSKEFEKMLLVKTDNEKLRNEIERLSVMQEDYENKLKLCDTEMERFKHIIGESKEKITTLNQENRSLVEVNQKLQKNVEFNFVETQTDLNNTLEDAIINLKKENAEVLFEMNEMNQVLKERGETISKLKVQYEDVKKKLQTYESEANQNVDNISQKDELIRDLQRQIEETKVDTDKNLEINRLKNEIENLKEKINTNLDSSYAESETMSTSTISRTEEGNRLKDLEGSWEERYGKLRNLAIKLKWKVRELTADLAKEQNEKNDVQQKLANSIKTISSLQTQLDKSVDDLDRSKKETQQCGSQLENIAFDVANDKQKLVDNDELIDKLKLEIDELKKEKTNTDNWKKQIGAKVQTFRKELEVNKVLKKEFEEKIVKLTAELDEKEKALKAECDDHKLTKSSLEHSNNECKKNSVLNLEMQDYERSVKELSQKLAKKQEEVAKVKNQFESQKSTLNAIREQNKILEERIVDAESELSGSVNEMSTYKKKISELEEFQVNKEEKIQSLTQFMETLRSENEDLSTELSKVIAEHQKVNGLLKNEKEYLRGHNLGLQQSLRETQDTLRLREDELRAIQNDYENYKVRAQSVLRQNHNRDVGIEEKLTEEVASLKETCGKLRLDFKESQSNLEQFKDENKKLSFEKEEVSNKLKETAAEVEELKMCYDQLSNKHQQSVLEHAETVRNLKLHAETLGQCYRQQLTEQENRHSREMIELQMKLDTAPSPTAEFTAPPMAREEGEGSESVENVIKLNLLHPAPIPLERLLGGDGVDQDGFIKKQLAEQESKVAHLTELLADTEQDLAKHVQMNKLLKEEIRRQQRSVEREKHAENLEYLKNVVFKFVTLQNGDEKSRLVPVLNTILKLSPEETQKLNLVAKGDPGIKGWATNYLPMWSPSK